MIPVGVWRLVISMVAGLCALVALGACRRAPPLTLYVDGIAPADVVFDVEPVRDPSPAAREGLAHRPDVDGFLRLPAGACGGPCRAVLVTFLVQARQQERGPPVVRLDSPASRPPRPPLVYRGGVIDPGRTGRIRGLVELWPEEDALVATMSASVLIVPPSAATTPQDHP